MKRIYRHVAQEKMNIQSFAMLSVTYLEFVLFQNSYSGLENCCLRSRIPATLVANTSEELTNQVSIFLYYI